MTFDHVAPIRSQGAIRTAPAAAGLVFRGILQAGLPGLFTMACSAPGGEVVDRDGDASVHDSLNNEGFDTLPGSAG